MYVQPNHRSARQTLRLTVSGLLVATLLLTALVVFVVRATYSHDASRRASGGANSTPQQMTLNIDANVSGAAFAPGAVGLSVEADELATPNLSWKHRSLVALMRHLGPGVLRLGGNSLDYSWWTSSAETPPAWATSVITPSDLVALRRLLNATHWRAILGVDLGHFDPSRAGLEARAAAHILGPQLLGFEIGNEPNSYGIPRVALRRTPWKVSTYLAEFAAYGTAIGAASGVTQLFGPDNAGEEWLPAIVAENAKGFSEITQHYYPTQYSTAKGVCKATSKPTAATLLSPNTLAAESSMLQVLARAGASTGHATRISETNTTGSCDLDGAPDTSPVFASALWSLDLALRAGSAGVAGVNFHGRLGRCGPNTFSPICEPNAVSARRGRVVARPEYYGLLAASQLEGGHFLSVHTEGQGATGLTAYATLHPDGEITLAIDNMSPTARRTVSLSVPGYGRATSEPLTAPSLGATGEVAFGGSAITGDGEVRGTASSLRLTQNTFRIVLAASSATVVRLNS